MKKLLLLLFAIMSIDILLAAPFSFLQHKITQPNGEIIECYVSGDEFYNWIHDKNGYTIIQNSDGYYYYASINENKIVPSKYKVNSVNPDKIGVKKWIKISKKDYEKKKLRFQVPSKYKTEGPQKAPHTGTLNNIVIYIRFADDTEISRTRQEYDDMMNSTTGYSLKSYFTEVSYNNLTVSSTHYPTCPTPATTNASYQDSHNRGYFRPYNATTNPTGYKTEEESTQREHQLLYDAITWINNNNPIDANLNIDGDNDGKVDNVCFMIKGNSDGWSDLLWAHRWVLYTKTININGKRVYDYTFQPENQAVNYVLCHEMFHALGAPDLYHYNENNFTPVGPWDLMEAGKGHMGAYMKWKYADAKWISSIQEITVSGTYTLNPLSSSTNNCFRIASPNSTNEFFVLEYRKKEGVFESYIPESGLLIYRINTDFDGNANFDNVSTFDEVYIYRPNGNNQTDGYIYSANFSSESGRTSINDATDPSSFLHNGLPGGLDISSISSAGNTISFYVYISNINTPANFNATGVSQSQIDLSWTLNSSNNDVVVAYSSSGIIGSPIRGTNYGVGSSIPGGGTVIYSGTATSFNHTNLNSGTSYTYRIWSKNASNEYSQGVTTSGSTKCGAAALPLTEGFNGTSISPCWTVTQVAQGEIKEEPASITQVQAGSTPEASPFEGTHMIKFNSTYCGAGNIMRLESPSFSTIGQSQVKMSFSWHRDTQWPSYLDNMKIQWSTDGSTWNDGPTYQRYFTSIGWTQQSYTLPSNALEQSTLKIAFLFTSQYGYNCYLDNLKITNTPTGVQEFAENEFMVYPNPSNGDFKFRLDKDFTNLNIQVFDCVGRIVFSKNYNSNYENSINLTDCSKGIYLVKIQVDGKVGYRKIVKE